MQSKHPKIAETLSHTSLSLAAACEHDPDLVYFDQWIARNVNSCLDGCADKVKLFRGRYRKEPALLASGVYMLEQIMCLYHIPHGAEMDAEAKRYTQETYFTMGMPLEAARLGGQRLLNDLESLPHLMLTPYTPYEEIIKKIPAKLEEERKMLEREIKAWKSKGVAGQCPWPNRETLVDFIATSLLETTDDVPEADVSAAETSAAAAAQAAEAAAAEAAKQQLLTCYICGGKHIGGSKACNKRCQKCLAFDSTSAGNGVAKICPGARGAACVVTSGEDVQRVVNNALGAPLPTNLRNLLVAANAKHRGIGGKGEANPAEASSAEVSMGEYVSEYEASVGEDDVLYGEFGELFLAPSDNDAAPEIYSD